jgi:cell division protein FtsL
MQRKKTKRHYIVFFMLIAIGVFFLLWFNFKIKNLSFEYQTLLKIKEELAEENNKLKIEYSLQSSPINIERLASEKLNLKKPSEKQYRFIK